MRRSAQERRPRTRLHAAPDVDGGQLVAGWRLELPGGRHPAAGGAGGTLQILCRAPFACALLLLHIARHTAMKHCTHLLPEASLPSAASASRASTAARSRSSLSLRSGRTACLLRNKGGRWPPSAAAMPVPRGGVPVAPALCQHCPPAPPGVEAVQALAHSLQAPVRGRLLHALGAAQRRAGREGQAQGVAGAGHVRGAAANKAGWQLGVAV